MGLENVDGTFDVATDIDHSDVDESANSGTGGGTIALWKLDRESLVRRLAGAEFSNNSAFGTPPALVDLNKSDSSPWDTTFEDGEAPHGVNVKGTAFDETERPLSGTATVTSDSGEELASKDVAGSFILASSPPNGVTAGADVETTSYTFSFQPSVAGLNYVSENISFRTNVGIFRYAAITGKVTQYDGSPATGVPVFGSGQGTTTNDQGEYNLLAPSGTDVDISAVGTTQTRTPVFGSTVTLDFQFSRLSIQVVDPEFNPLENTPVKIGSDSYTTNSDGKVILENASVRPYNIVVGGDAEYVVNVEQQGELIEKQYGQSFAGYRVTVTEKQTDLPVVATTVRFKDEGIASQTNGNGRASAIIQNPGEKELQVGVSDRRYSTKTIKVEVEEGEVRQRDVELTRQQNAPTY